MEFNSNAREECRKTRDTAANGIRKTGISVINKSASHCTVQLTLCLILLCHLLPERWIIHLHTAINPLSFLKSLYHAHVQCPVPHMVHFGHLFASLWQFLMFLKCHILSWSHYFLCQRGQVSSSKYKFQDNLQQFCDILGHRYCTEKWKLLYLFNVSIY